MRTFLTKTSRWESSLRMCWASSKMGRLMTLIIWSKRFRSSRIKWPVTSLTKCLSRYETELEQELLARPLSLERAPPRALTLLAQLTTLCGEAINAKPLLRQIWRMARPSSTSRSMLRNLNTPSSGLKKSCKELATTSRRWRRKVTILKIPTRTTSLSTRNLTKHSRKVKIALKSSQTRSRQSRTIRLCYPSDS